MGLSEIDLDVAKPSKISIYELSEELCKAKGVKSVEITVTAIDMEVERLKVTVKGKDIRVKDLEKIIDEFGASIQSIDRVVYEK